MHSKEWDVIVAGAGPAGSRAAELMAKQGARVLLLDPKAPWEKPCGGGLTAAALANTPELRELEDRAMPIHELQAVAPSGASVLLPLRSQYWVVSRTTLSEWALERAQTAGARFLSVGVSNAEREPGGWKVTDSRSHVHRARWLIGADGAASRIRGIVAPGLKPELAPTRVVFPTGGSPSGRAVFQFLPQAEGYVWDFPRPGHHSVGIGVAPGTFRRDVLDTALTQYQLAETGAVDGTAGEAGAVIATSAWTAGRMADLGGSDYALLGDAGGMADPATGEGIDYALRSASIAARVFTPAKGFSRYPSAIKREFGGEFRRAKLIRRWLYHPEVAERLVARAKRTPRGALLLVALADAINDHRSLWAVLWRVIRAREEDVGRVRDVCDCPTDTSSTALVSATLVEATNDQGSD